MRDGQRDRAFSTSSKIGIDNRYNETEGSEQKSKGALVYFFDENDEYLCFGKWGNLVFLFSCNVLPSETPG